MRVVPVAKARKSPGDCSGCGKTIEAGESYKWVKGRFTAKLIRCNTCRFKPGELTSSKLGAVYDAQETTHKVIGEWDGKDVEDLKSALEELASVAREVAEEYRESAENIRASFTESPKADECEEKADELEGWADELEGVGFEEFDSTGEGTREDWIEECRGEADDPVDNCPC